MADLVQEIEQHIKGAKSAAGRLSVGSIREVGDGVARIEGLGDVMLNEMLDFGGGVTGLALNLDETEVAAIILGDYTTLREGGEVHATGRLLEVGSYCGLFLSVARERGYDVVGVEPSRWASRYAGETLGIPSHCGTLSDVPRDAAPFDVVCAWDVLEHVSDDAAAMRELARVTAPGGWCLVMVPLAPGVPRTDEDPAVTDPAERERRFLQRDHVRLYGADLGQRLAAAGFAVEHVRPEVEFGAQAMRRHRLLGVDHLWLCRPEGVS